MGASEKNWHQSRWLWEKKCASNQFLEIQKNQLIELHEHLERYSIVLPVFRFNTANIDLILMKSCLLPILVNEPTVIKRVNQFISFIWWIPIIGYIVFFGQSNKS